MVGIYQIKNIENGFVYIGSSKNIKNRIAGHKYSLRHGKNVNKKLQEDWNKFGEQSFSFEILEEVGEDELLEKEAFFINKGENVYNLIKPKLIEYGINLKKKCSICGLEKHYSEFHKDGHQKNGLKNQCKECRKKKKEKKKYHQNLDKCINRSIYRAIKNNKSGYIWERIIGLTLDELKKHLESQFDDIMNWENYGSYWVIDKVIPTSIYKYSDKINNEFKKAWSLKNLRPYPRKLHNKKRGKFVFEVMNYYKVYDILPIGLLGDVLWQEKNS